MDSMPTSSKITRLGFHYYPDALHYRETDLAVWLPELQAMATSWLTLQAPLNRAIPESFLRQLLDHQIQPILQFHFSPAHPPALNDFNLLCQTYARWGVRYIVLFDRPNCRSNWSTSTWAQSSLVERFLDIFQPLALATAQAGLVPVFPPLQPGGDYWDTAFLRTAFEGLLRRNQPVLLDRMAISSYAWTNRHPLSWGSGGPERWPAARPYDTPTGSEDQRGFRIFDWYLALSEAIFGIRLPILVFGAGLPSNDQNTAIPVDVDLHASQNLSIARLMMGDKQEFDPVPSEVLACNFWLLTAPEDHPSASTAWYKPDGSCLPVVSSLQQWATDHHWTSSKITHPAVKHPKNLSTDRPISHYILLPSKDWGASDSHMEILRSLIKKYHPTIGFSPAEAVLAQRVTLLGGHDQVPDSILDGLTSSGCQVDDLRGDGTTIATKISNE